MHPTEPDGSPNWFEAYHPGVLRLRDGSVIEGFALDYDIQRFNVLVEHDRARYDVPGFMVREFSLDVAPGKQRAHSPAMTRRFINPNEFFDLPRSVPHFVEVYDATDPRPFVVYYGAEIKARAPNYNPALDVGSRAVRYLKKERGFFYDGTDFRSIPGTAAKARRFFFSEYPEAKRIVQQRKWKLNAPEEVETLVRLLGAASGRPPAPRTH